jgi:hypothetical protein
VDQCADARFGGRLEDARRAAHVHALELVAVAAGLDQPGEMDDGVRAVEPRPRVVALDVERDPLRPRRPPAGHPPRDADDLGHALVGRERRDDARPHVARGSCDDDLHGWNTTLKAPSCFFWNMS